MILRPENMREAYANHECIITAYPSESGCLRWKWKCPASVSQRPAVWDSSSAL